MVFWNFNKRGKEFSEKYILHSYYSSKISLPDILVSRVIVILIKIVKTKIFTIMHSIFLITFYSLY